MRQANEKTSRVEHTWPDIIKNMGQEKQKQKSPPSYGFNHRLTGLG